ncbi:MAG: ribosome recycling factor [Alphaproteobacteria bacterium]|nr:ribosome recycling factor [Alphaproteobacteria bacterium]MCW5752465.1 ribosome recycling factor [Alphaproteobacteria bacterium]
MSDAEYDIDDIERRMNGAVEALRHDFVGLRTGRANAGMLEPVVVNAYGADMPLNQVATINVPEPRMITVQVWDRGNVQAVEKAIRSAGLGLNPSVDGQLVRVPIPELTQQRRQELTKVASQYAEHARVAVRNVRRDGMEKLKRLQRDSHMSEDDHDMWAEETQRLTDEAIKKIDELLAHKQKDIMQV